MAFLSLPGRSLARSLLVTLALGASVASGLSCGGDDDDGEPRVDGAFVVLAPSAYAATLQDFVATSGVSGAVVAGRADPARELSRGGGAVRVALVDDGRCAGCFRVEGSGGRYTVRGGGVLGVQYGLAQLMEEMGVRFFHPWKTHVPATLASPDASPELGRDHVPAMELRGLQLHTLHPIEAYFDLWEPGAASLEGAKRLVDWTVKNRGNYLQWPALNNVLDEENPSVGQAWREHTRQIVDYAHQRGVGIGLGVQLSGVGNLQLAVSLFDSPLADDRDEQIHTSLRNLTRDLPIDQISLSFGEFSKIDPAVFIEGVNNVRQAQLDVLPQATLGAIIHVGNYKSLQITYQGESLLYYFLVKYVDPSIVPWVHTVMYYNLFEDAGGAYLHDQFDKHREFAIDRLKNRQPVVYQPESAYWVAFDNSVPTYLPLYMRSRHLDVAKLREQSGNSLNQHVTFSSGWEWGYWQNDYATLRLNYELPASWHDLTAQMFAPWGASGQDLAGAINDLGDLQHDSLMTRRLAAYIAGRDFLIDYADKGGQIGQPTRVTFDGLIAMSKADQDTFESSVIAPLESLAQATAAIQPRAEAATLPGGERFHAEVVDGVAIDALRATYIAAAYRAALAYARGEPATDHLALMDATLDKARPVIERRHADLHSPLGDKLYTNGPNATAYQYGYLREASTLCFWRRERWQIRMLVLGEQGKDPGCVL